MEKRIVGEGNSLVVSDTPYAGTVSHLLVETSTGRIAGIQLNEQSTEELRDYLTELLEEFRKPKPGEFESGDKIKRVHGSSFSAVTAIYVGGTGCWYYKFDEGKHLYFMEDRDDWVKVS